MKKVVSLLFFLFIFFAFLDPLPKGFASPLTHKRLSASSVQKSGLANNVGKVVKIPPLEAHSLSQTFKKDFKVGNLIISEQSKLLDFRQIKAPWLKQHPIIAGALKKIIQSTKKEVLQKAQALFKTTPHSQLLPFKLYVLELKLFKPKNLDLLSARIKIYTYSGGAHGGIFWQSLNYSKSQKKFLSVERLLNPQVFLELRQGVRALLCESEKQGGPYDKYAKAQIYRGTVNKEDFKILNFHENQVIVIFPEYQVAPYAAGSFEVFYPL